jgi:hypothetical protein
MLFYFPRKSETMERINLDSWGNTDVNYQKEGYLLNNL